MRTLLIVIALVGCSSNSNSKTPDAFVQKDAPAQTLDCPTYCSTIASACTTTLLQQYSTNAQCLASCGKFPVGALTDTGGNTLGCRLYHANNAKTSPTVHCTHAGPGGDGVCGMNCEGFCSIVTAACPTQYPSPTDCMTTCAGFATTPAYSSNVQIGNSLACRLYHATAAADNPGLHCPHTLAVNPQGPCN